jgi:hypothetical protein
MVWLGRNRECLYRISLIFYGYSFYVKHVKFKYYYYNTLKNIEGRRSQR